MAAPDWKMRPPGEHHRLFAIPFIIHNTQLFMDEDLGQICGQWSWLTFQRHRAQSMRLLSLQSCQSVHATLPHSHHRYYPWRPAGAPPWSTVNAHRAESLEHLRHPHHFTQFQIQVGWVTLWLHSWEMCTFQGHSVKAIQSTPFVQ